jgi:hypothetical protein
MAKFPLLEHQPCGGDLEMVLERERGIKAEKSPDEEHSDVSVVDLGVDTGAIARQESERRQACRVTVWFLGVVFASLMPLATTYVHGADVNKAPSWITWLGHGDLLITGPVVAVAGFVEIGLTYKSIKRDKLPSIYILATAAMLIIAAQAIWYGDVSAILYSRPEDLARETVAVGSIACYIASVLCGCVGVILSGADQ